MLLEHTVAEGEEARVRDAQLLSLLGLANLRRPTAGEVWRRLMEGVAPQISSEETLASRVILDRGPLARRILKALGDPGEGTRVSREELRALWHRLGGCLAENEAFVP